MWFIRIVFAFVFLFSAAEAFAYHGDKSGPCSVYQATCVNDPSVAGVTDKKSKRAAMRACVGAAAKAAGANGQKCLELQAKIKGGSGQGSAENSAASTTSPGTN